MNAKFNPHDLVLWSDDALLAVNKTPGLLAIRGVPGVPYLTEVLEPAFGPLWIVHRLDRDTSGVLVMARTTEAHRELNTQFQERKALKIYHALVVGNSPWMEHLSDLPLRPDGDRRHRTVVDTRHGKPSQTLLQVLERFGEYALVQAAPQTGRTHQIRAHLSNLGLPIVADALYGGGSGLFLSAIKPGYHKGKRAERPLLARTALHALSLTIHHPVTGQPLSFEAPYPRDMASALRQLRKHCKQTT